MNTRTALTVSACLLAAGAAVAQDGPSRTNRLAELALAFDAAGLDPGWEVLRGGAETPLEMVDLRLAGGTWLMQAEGLRFSGGPVALRNVVIRGQGEAGDGTIRVGRIALSDPGGFGVLDRILGGRSAEFGSVSCAPGMPTRRRITFHDVVLNGDADALPADAAGAESLRASILETFLHAERHEVGCVVSETTRGRDLEIRAIDGARLKATRGLVERDTRPVGEEGIATGTRIALDNIVLEDAAGLSTASASRLEAGLSLDHELMEFRADMGDTGAMLERLNRTVFSGTFEIEDIAIDVAGFLPSETRISLGLGNTDFLEGDVLFDVQIDDGTVLAETRIDLPGLVLLDAATHLDLPSDTEVTLPGFLSAKLPVPGEVLDLELHGLELEWRDKGAGEIVEAVTGISPAAHFDRVTRLLELRSEGLPPFVVSRLEKVTGFLSEMIAHGGRVSIAPDTPVRGLQIVVQGLMAPDEMARTLGLEAEIHK